MPITLANRVTLSLQGDQVLTGQSTIDKAGLVMLELPGLLTIPAQQLQRAVQAIRASSSSLIGITIPMKDLQEQPAEQEQTAVALALQMADAIRAELPAFDGTRSRVLAMHLLDRARTALQNDVGGSSRSNKQARQGQALPVLAVSIPTGREAEDVTDDEVIEFARLLKEHGCDLMMIASEDGDHLRQRLFSDRVRNEVGMPTMLVREAVSADEMKTNILAGRADLYLIEYIVQPNKDPS